MKSLLVFAALTLAITQQLACAEEPDCGLSDKISYLEFYDVKPEFDQCGESTIARISQLPVDDLGNNPVRIIIKDMAIDIEYGDTPYSNPELASLPVEIR